MKRAVCRWFVLILAFLAMTPAWASPAPQDATAGQQPAPAAPSGPVYQPKFPGDPAHSDDEALALAYMRVVIRAQNLYKKRHDKYSTSLADLAGTGSFTKRMAKTTDRGNYTVEFHSKNKGESYTISMLPKQFDPLHRAFYAKDDGIMRAEEGKPAKDDSAKIK